MLNFVSAVVDDSVPAAKNVVDCAGATYDVNVASCYFYDVANSALSCCSC